MTRMVIGYDGSDEACRALDFAAAALPAAAAIVANVISEPTLGAVSVPVAGPTVPPASDPVALGRAAQAAAEAGAERARAAGLDATAVVRRPAVPEDVAHALHDIADEHQADLVVVGHRRASRLESALVGSVSVAAVREQRHPVLVVNE